MKLRILLIALITAGVAFTQEKKADFAIEGQLAAATDGKGVFTNFGGPSLKFHFKPVSLAISMMPSLRFQNEDLKPLVTPMLGFGPQLYFLKSKKLVFTFPAYYNTASRVWTFTAGIGYVLTTKK